MTFWITWCTNALQKRERYQDSMKIAILSPIAWRTPPRHYGPWEQVASWITEGLVKEGLEVTLYATRIDVAEEVSRLTAHIDEVERVIKKGGACGKRLDFLAQELNREANTLGSKAVHMDMTRTAIDLKLLIEQMREQIQNIE